MPAAISSIVAGVATLQEVDPVVAPAVQLARELGAALHLVHSYDVPEPWLVDAYARAGAPGPDLGERHRQQLQERLEAQAREAAAGAVEVHCHTAAGSAGAALAERAQRVGAGLIVVGATRRATMTRNILGTTAERAIRMAPAPVLVLREAPQRPLRRVLLTTDLSEFSARIQERAHDTLEAVFPADRPALRALLVVAFDAAMPPPMRPERLLELAEGGLRRYLAERRPRTAAVEPRVRIGEPAKEIVAEAFDWQADLLVLGTHGGTPTSRVVLGSVACESVRSALCNVLVIPGADLLDPGG